MAPGNVKKDTRTIAWTDKAKKAFEKCKNDLVNCTLLAHPVQDAQLQLRIDASDFAVGGALEQISISSDGEIDFELLAKDQQNDPELESTLKKTSGNSLELKLLTIPNSLVKVYCDTKSNVIRPFVPKPFRQVIISKMHGLSHPGIRGTTKLINARFVWPGMNKEIQQFLQHCMECQRSKVTRHNKAPLANFLVPNERFSHINIDLVGSLPVSMGHRYALTIIDPENKMRFFALILVVAVVMPLVVSGLDISGLLKQVGPLIKKAKCAAPCIIRGAKNIDSCENGPFAAICDNVDEIVKRSRSCIKKCDVDPVVQKYAVNVVKTLCNKSKHY
ncbi:Transposon Tf2-6 polyprotein [Pseudolycoriella hygida]|uniref:RNA-directed DNA polymerase n=1 Tax=Pseudolycoriella hygida TaxID=35572 RepID=A0A9Q0NGV9_9DIPT|nr:Transposon Tf2-6 polyprotein [Pseudolycoriella hygida]